MESWIGELRHIVDLKTYVLHYGVQLEGNSRASLQTALSSFGPRILDHKDGWQKHQKIMNS